MDRRMYCDHCEKETKHWVRKGLAPTDASGRFVEDRWFAQCDVCGNEEKMPRGYSPFRK